MNSVELSMDGNKKDQSSALSSDIREVLNYAAEQGKKNVKEFSGIYTHLGLNWKDYLSHGRLSPEKLVADLTENHIPPNQQKQFICRMIHCVMHDSNGSLEELLRAAFD